ncbi:MAG TPA: FHA domain-containing protein [Anaerolineae bacterium]|nr:FHA domain-containing protein [Anaerolineae bacterium]
MASFKTCPTCDRRNDAVNATCTFCGTALAQAEIFDAPALERPRLTINHHPVQVPLKTELIIGRADRANDWIPDIDLTPHGGNAASGVSRRHAQLVWDGTWWIQDLNSANGTLVNQVPVTPGQRVALPDGAIIQIGTLYIIFYN